jgi:methanogenic corrinoid protein MtbC1
MMALIKETKDKIITNSQALSEEISNMRYLIEYMNNNNNNKKKFIIMPSIYNGEQSPLEKNRYSC